MTIEDFWNRAFIASLARLPVDEAKIEAERATQVCIEYWQANIYNFAPEQRFKWQQQDIAAVPRLWPVGDPRNVNVVKPL